MPLTDGEDALNSLLLQTRPYPFTRLNQLLSGVTPPAHLTPISLGIGEPKHPTPQCITDTLIEHIGSIAHYPSMRGEVALREAISAWCARRFGAAVDPFTQILPVLGSREALFSFVQSHVNAADNPCVIMPTPFYQIYEGAALLAGAEPVYLPLTQDTGYRMDLTVLDESVLKRAQVVFVCSPNNPTGSTIGLDEWKELFAMSDRYGFVLCSDECYSEIYCDESRPPLGALDAARQLGRTDFKNLIIFQSLSKRSNAPGMRSGFVAGDARLIEPFLLYRTYHGSSMCPAIQRASTVAWSDETHVVENRRLYREKFDAAQPIINSVLDAPMPDASFYLWTKVPGSDEAFTKALYEQQALTVLPGSYLSRSVNGFDAGYGYVRLALVAEPAEVTEAARRIERFMRDYAA